MTNLRERLKSCFSAVFPDLDQDEIEHAGMASLAMWDSLATVSLIAVIQEEFQTEFSLDEMELLISFELILELLERKNDNS